MAEKVKLADRKHPLYSDNVDNWDLYRDSVKGGDVFVNEDNLFTHRLEDETDFTERLERAYYLNYCDVIPTIYNNYIFKEKINRPPDKELEIFRKNCDGRGTGVGEFVKKIGFFSKIFGVMHALVDMPPKTKSKVTRKQAKDMSLYPYCSLVYPSQLVDWSLDASGNFNWIIVQSTHYNDADPNKERDVQIIYKLITREEWRIEDDSGKPFKFDDKRPNKGPNELGVVPLISMYHQDIDDDKVGESLIKDIVFINRAILNWCSCIDEMIERQTFSQLVVPDDGTLAEESESGDDPLRRVSTSSVWTFNAESRHPPAYISPNTENIVTIWDLVVDHIKEIFRIGGLIGSTEDMFASTSGRSKQMGFMSVNSALAETSGRYQKFENDISSLAYEFLGKNPEDFQPVKYPESFDIAALEDEIDSLFTIMSKNFSTVLNKQMMKNIARKAVPLADETTRQEIEDEIESGTGLLENMMEEDKDIKPKNDDGNPNSDLGKSFRSKRKLEKRDSTHRPAE